jgi:hypothetical protein
MSFTGRVADAGGPIHGAVNLVFRIYDKSSGGTLIWEETHTGLAADQGLVYAELGSSLGNDLDESVFDGGSRYIEITVNGDTMSPRVALQSVPYAVRASVAGSADTLGGKAASDFAAAVHGHSEYALSSHDHSEYALESHDHAGSYLPLGSTLSCTAGRMVRGIDPATGNVACADDASTTYTGSGAISVAGSTISLSTGGCTAGSVWKYNGSTWSCEPDQNTTYTGSGGVAVSGSAISLSTAGCGAGFVWKYDGSTWVCQADDSTTYEGGGGIAVTGTTISLSTSGCVAGEVWKYNGSTWSCEPDQNTTYTGGGAIAVTGTTISLSTSGCVAGEVWKYNGSTWSCEPDQNTTYTGTGPITVDGTTIGLSAAGCVAGEVWKYNGTSWECVPDNDTKYTGSGAVSVSGTTVSLSTTGCVAGEVWKWTGTTWDCVPDNDTTYGPGTGLGLTGTTFYADTTYLQRRVGGSCGAGYAITSVTATGAVTCQRTKDYVGSAQGYCYLNLCLIADSSTSDRWVPSSASVNLPQGGTCLVTVHSYAHDLDAGDSAIGPMLQTALQNLDTNTAEADGTHGPFMTISSHATISTTVSKAWAWTLAAGTNYRFGCRLANVPVSWQDDMDRCYASWICSSN